VFGTWCSLDELSFFAYLVLQYVIFKDSSLFAAGDISYIVYGCIVATGIEVQVTAGK